MSAADQLDQLAGYADKEPGEQGSAEWLYERVGHCTGSEFENVMAFLKNGKEAAPRYKYRMELISERLTGQPAERYVSKYMEWGTEHEPAARMAYEAHTGAMVTQPGFIHHPTIPLCGGSVDGLVDDDGIIEIKCPETCTHLETLLHSMDDEHKPQTQGYLWITGRKWCDFVSYDPRLPHGLDLYIQRVLRDDVYIAELAGNVMQFLAEVDAQHKALLAIAAKHRIAPEQEHDPMEIDIPL